MFKKILLSIVCVISIMSLVACSNTDVPSKEDTPTTSTTNNELSGENTDTNNKLMTVNTAEYTLTFNMFGSWSEYAGDLEIRNYSKTVLARNADNEDATFFYILVDEYVDDASVSFKDKVVSKIEELNQDVEFENISDLSSGGNHKLVVTYLTSDGNDAVKNYQQTIVKDGYMISFVYSSPKLIYNNQKGYIDDMIQSASFSLNK